MLLRGIVVAASGFLFIFSPGLPIGLLARRSPPIKRELIYWGAALWLVTLLPSLFIQSLLRQALIGDQAPVEFSWQPVVLAQTLLGALLTALFVLVATVIVLRRQSQEAGATLNNGLALGFGIGLIAQVFTGLNMVGAGYRLIYGDFSSTPTLASLASATPLELVLGLLPLILYRPGLLVVSAVQGVLVGRSLLEGKQFFWLAVLVNIAFSWGTLALQLVVGGENPGQVSLGAVDPVTSIVTSTYYILAFSLAYRWLLGQMAGWRQASQKSYKRRG